MIDPFIKEEAIEVDQLKETNSEGHRGKTSPEGLNVGTVPTLKMHNVGTIPTFKMNKVGTELSYATLYNVIKLISIKLNLIK